MQRKKPRRSWIVPTLLALSLTGCQDDPTVEEYETTLNYFLDGLFDGDRQTAEAPPESPAEHPAP
jgi:hypothetical protein